MSTQVSVPKPSTTQVSKYLAQWDSLESYVAQESSLRKLYTQTYPSNVELDDVLIKVCSLNDFYSTNIFSPFAVAKHIIGSDIDEGLAAGDLEIVNKIAKVQMPGGKVWNLYSFASKYCSHHRPTVFPIYDYYVDRVLMHFKKQDKFYGFKKPDLQSYPRYKQILSEFAKYYGLQSFDVKQIDKYLWQLGKEYFPKDY